MQSRHELESKHGLSFSAILEKLEDIETMYGQHKSRLLPRPSSDCSLSTSHSFEEQQYSLLHQLYTLITSLSLLPYHHLRNRTFLHHIIGMAPTSAALSCPASNGTQYVAGGATFTIHCGTDYFGGDLSRRRRFQKDNLRWRQERRNYLHSSFWSSVCYRVWH